MKPKLTKKEKRRETNKLIDRLNREYRGYFMQVGENPQGFDFGLDQPSRFDRLVWRSSRLTRRMFKLRVPGERADSTK